MSIDMLEGLLPPAASPSAADSPPPALPPAASPSAADSPPPVAAGRAELCNAETQTCPHLSAIPLVSHDVRVRLENESGGAGKLVSLGEWLKLCKQQGLAKPPVLTEAERVRRAQQETGAWRAHHRHQAERAEGFGAQAAQLKAQLAEQQEEIERLHAAHAAELAALCAQHAAELQAACDEERAAARRHLDAVQEWGRIQRRQLQAQDAAAHQRALHQQREAHERELARRSACSATWRTKRAHQQLQHGRSRRCREEQRRHFKAGAPPQQQEGQPV